MADAGKQSLIEKHGWPSRRESRDGNRVMVFAHQTEESALDFAAFNRERLGYDSAVEFDGDCWVSTVDIGARVDEIAQNYTEAFSG